MISSWPIDKNKKVESLDFPAEIHAVKPYLIDPSHCRCVYGKQLYNIENSSLQNLEDNQKMKKTASA